MREVARDASSTGAHDGSTGLLDELLHAAEKALSLPERPASRWHRAGMSPRTERWLDLAGGVLVAALMIGWTWSIVDVATTDDDDRPGPSAMAAMTSALTSSDAPNAAYLTDASLSALSGELRGASGKLRVQIKPAGAPLDAESLPEGAELRAEEAQNARSTEAPRAGIWRMAVAVGNAIKPIADFSLISMRPLSDKRNGRVGLYFVGNWPGEKGRVSTPSKAPPDRYRPPPGFIEVTQQNADTRVSEHFKLRDFLTHDQASVWPKFLVLEMRNVDKLELVLADLQRRGIDVRGVRVMSGFRTPQYNKAGGDPSGRAGLSRHMYGDAADIFIDSNGDGVMDDLNHDHRIDIGDARVVSQAVDRVEAAHPELVGGAGVYPAAPGHGPFIHIDTRGYRARWIGSGGGS
ncbi:MAG TPA: hypothetical protein VGP25_06030 [Gemmatimonadaceae bacterium]|nr:hypothetical protein [Gemmatimonadaceae bacterium]